LRNKTTNHSNWTFTALQTTTGGVSQLFMTSATCFDQPLVSAGNARSHVVMAKRNEKMKRKTIYNGSLCHESNTSRVTSEIAKCRAKSTSTSTPNGFCPDSGICKRPDQISHDNGTEATMDRAMTSSQNLRTSVGERCKLFFPFRTPKFSICVLGGNTLMISFALTSLCFL